ncbi:DUF1189 family protein [Mycoplasmatota bacterium WC44]
MKIFNFFHRMSKRGTGTAILFTALLAVIFALSIVIVLGRGISTFDSDVITEEYNKEFGCSINNYELTCKKDYYLLDDLTIDLREDSEVPNILNGTFLTKDKIYTSGSEMTYKELLIMFDYDSSTFTLQDGLDVLKKFTGPFLIIVFVVMTILTWIGHMIFNFLRAIINQLLAKGMLKEEFDYNYSYRLTIYAVIPLVILNAITRSIFSETLTGYLTSFLPVFAWIVKLALDSMIILFFTKLILDSKDDGDVIGGIE